jgi:hypothetical protein
MLRLLEKVKLYHLKRNDLTCLEIHRIRQGRSNKESRALLKIYEVGLRGSDDGAQHPKLLGFWIFPSSGFLNTK